MPNLFFIAGRLALLEVTCCIQGRHWGAGLTG